MRDFKYSPGNKFGEHLRKAKAAARGDRTMRGEAKPTGATEGMGKKEEPKTATERSGKPGHPSGTGKHDKHRIKGKVRHVSVKAVHGGHVVTVDYHHKPADKSAMMGMPEEHFHANSEDAKAHMGAAMDAMEPEGADSSDMAQQI
jgi:hypothetical protein